MEEKNSNTVNFLFRSKSNEYKFMLCFMKSNNYLLCTALLSDLHGIDVWAICLPWLTIVNSLANSMLGHFYTARNSKVHFARLGHGIAKATE